MLACARRVVVRSCYKQHLNLSGRICIRAAATCQGRRSYWWGKKATPPSQTTETEAFDSPSNADDEPVMQDSAAGAEEVQNEPASVSDSLTQMDTATLGTDLGDNGSGDVVTSATDVAHSYYPTDLLRQGIELMHEATGMPYWIVVVGGTLALRSAMLPMRVARLRWEGKREAMEAELEPINREYLATLQKMETEGDLDDAHFVHLQKLKSRMRAVGIKYGVLSMDGVSKFKTLGRPLGSFVLNLSVLITCIIGLNDMGCYCTDWAIGGPAAFINLNLPDPTHSLPVLYGVMQLIGSIFYKVTLEGERKARFERAAGVVSLLTIPLVGYLPSGTGLFMTTSTCFRAVSNGLLSVPKIRKALSLPPLPSSKP